MAHQEGPRWRCCKLLPMLLVYLTVQTYLLIRFIGIIVISRDKIQHPLTHSGDISNVSQLVRDWHTRPFVSIQAVEGDACPEGTEPVFYSEWKGLELGCHHKERIILKGYVETFRDWVDGVGVGAWDIEACPRWSRTPEVKAVNQTNIFGNLMCGTRGGDAFIDATRPDINGNCPSGTEPCSSATSADHTLCYSQDELAEKCPINQIYFTTRVEADTLNATIYEKIPLHDDTYLVYSKT